MKGTPFVIMGRVMKRDVYAVIQCMRYMASGVKIKTILALISYNKMVII